MLNKQKLELLNESISLTTSLNQQNTIIKSRKAEIKLSETKIQNLLKKSRNLENDLQVKISNVTEDTKRLREEFLKIDGIQEIQIRKKIRRKGSMDSPTKKWKETGKVKIKGEGEWNLESKTGKFDKLFKKRGPKRSSTFIEGKSQDFGIVDCSENKESLGMGYLGLTKDVKDTWDFGEDGKTENKGGNTGGEGTDIQGVKRIGLGSAKKQKISRLDESLNSFDDHSSDSDSKTKVNKQGKKGKSKHHRWRADKGKGFYHLKSESFYDSKKKKKTKKGISNNISFKSKSQLMQENHSLLNEDIDIQDFSKGYCKVIPTKLGETKMKKQDLVKLYKKLMPEAKRLIQTLKARKNEVLRVNSKISGFIDKMDNNLNQKYRCKRCFKKFVINENQQVSLLTLTLVK